MWLMMFASYAIPFLKVISLHIQSTVEGKNWKEGEESFWHAAGVADDDDDVRWVVEGGAVEKRKKLFIGLRFPALQH